jgi:hypothetical protein
MQGRQAGHQLQILPSEVEDAKREVDTEHVHGQRPAEGAVGEQLHVDQRIGQRPLPAHEEGSYSQPGDDHQRRRPAKALHGDLLEPVYHREHGNQR